MAMSETHRLASQYKRTTNGHLSAVQIETRPQPMSVGRVARSLMRDFPGWQCWYGGATRVWWGMPPLGYGYRALIEAATPDELAARVHQIRAANGTSPTAGARETPAIAPREMGRLRPRHYVDGSSVGATTDGDGQS